MHIDYLLVLELTLLAAVVFVVLSVVWSTLRVGISPMPSSKKAIQVMLAAADNRGEGPIVDLGSGWGTVAIACARRYPGRQVIGYEVSLIPWGVSVIFKHIMRLENLTLRRENFLSADLSNTSVILCYLYPDGMLLLQEKLNREKFQDTLIVSNTFALSSHTPVKVIRLEDAYRTPIYVYRQGVKWYGSGTIGNWHW